MGLLTILKKVRLQIAWIWSSTQRTRITYSRGNDTRRPFSLAVLFPTRLKTTKIKQKEKEVRILILGLDNAGKTTVVRKYCDLPIDEIQPTLGFSIQTRNYDMETSSFQLNLWDVGGQSSIRAYWRNYFEATDGILWVVDSTDVARLTVCAQELKQLLQQERLAGATLLVLANKQDVTGAKGRAEIAKALQLDDVQYHNRHWKIVGCSAVTGQGLAEGMDWLVHDVSNRIFMLS